MFGDKNGPTLRTREDIAYFLYGSGAPYMADVPDRNSSNYKRVSTSIDPTCTLADGSSCITEVCEMRGTPQERRESREEFRNEISAYYKNPVLVKTETTSQGIGVYLSRVNTGTVVGGVSVIAALVINDDTPIGTAVNLSRIPWTCFQTKKLDDLPRNLPSFGYLRRRLDVNHPLACKIRIQERTDTRERYSGADPRLCDVLEYIDMDIGNRDHADEGTIIHALETFECTLVLQND